MPGAGVRAATAAVFFTLNFAFATAVWSANSRTLHQHGTSVLFLAAGRAALVTRRTRIVAVAGVLLGLAVVARHTTDNPVLRYLVWSAIGVFALYTKWSDWAGGHTYGYRFLFELVPILTLLLAACWERFIVSRVYLRALFLVAMVASVYVHGLGAKAAPCSFDDAPNTIDLDHPRLSDVANGEIARRTQQEVNAWAPALGGH